MIPVYNEKALILNDFLIIADLHIGLERELFNKGMKVPSQIAKIEQRIIDLLNKTGKKKLIILGDLKHNIPTISWQEYNEIPKFIKRLSQYAEIILIKGNHDGYIEKIIPDLKVKKELSVNGKILLLHGHANPKKLDYEYFIIGHNHPGIQLRGKFGFGNTESAWVRLKFTKNAMDKINMQKKPEVVVLPAFNDLIYGVPFNSPKMNSLLGPFFKKGLVDIDNGRAFLLDSTYLGKIKDLKMEIPYQKSD
jgi:hypothetical protein